MRAGGSGCLVSETATVQLCRASFELKLSFEVRAHWPLLKTMFVEIGQSLRQCRAYRNVEMKRYYPVFFPTSFLGSGECLLHNVFFALFQNGFFVPHFSTFTLEGLLSHG